jgi:uroporphyrinogen decarboxylase
MMNSRERILCTINHQEPDRVPLDLGGGHACKFTKYFYIKLLDYFGIKDEELEICHLPYQLVYASDKVLDLLGNDVRCPRLRPIPQEKSPYAKKWDTEDSYYVVNDWGTKYRMPKEQGLYFDLVDVALAKAGSEEDDESFVWPVPSKFQPASRKVMEEYRAAGYATTITEVFGNGFFQTGPLVYGFEHWFMMMASEPKRCQRFMETLLQKKIEYYDNLFEVYGGLVDVTAEADDYGTQNGLMASPKMIREQILPYHKRLIEHIKSKGDIKMTLHSCGSVSDALPDIIEAGFDCLNPVQISAARMSPEYLKSKYGKEITFWGGGINTQDALPKGTPERVREETKRNIETFAPGGGFVFSAVHNIQDDVPIENFIAMWETYKDNCKY